MKPELQKETPKYIKETPKKSKLTTYITIGLAILLVLFFILTNQITTPENSVLIMWLTISVMVNLLIIMILTGTGIGLQTTKRFLNKWKFKTGKYVNTIFLSKTGTGKEFFKKRDEETGTFKIHNLPYVLNPLLLLNFDGIPSYIHREGNPDPLNIWDNKLANELSNSEMDIAMNSKGNFDFKQWFEKNRIYILIAIGVLILISAVAIYFSYSNFQMLTDGTYKATEVICKNIPEATTLIAQGIN
jgi:hypothetical protein